MRIRSTSGGSGSGSSGPGRRDDSGERRQTFRRKQRVGDRVRGTMLGWESPGLAWVEISGVRLLAALESGPEPGAPLTFLVKALEPDIVLQELPAAAGGDSLVAESVAGFWAARAAFEHAVQDAPLPEDLADASDPRTRLHAHLAAHPPALAAWLRAQSAVEALNAMLVPARKIMLLYRPELMPAAWDHELLVNHGRELAWAFTLPHWGRCQVRILHHPPMAGARVFLERPEHLEPLKRVLPKLVETIAAVALPNVQNLDRIDILSVGQLPPGSGQLLAGLFTNPAEGRPTTGFSARV